MEYAKVLALVEGMNGPTLWRVLQPFTELQRQKEEFGLDILVEWGIRDDSRLSQVINHFDAVILPRLHWQKDERSKGDKWFAAFHKAGMAIIYELDDDFFSEEYVRFMTTVWKMSKEEAEERRECILYAITSSDGITTSNHILATRLMEYTDKPIKVVGNYIDLLWWEKLRKIGKKQRQIPGLTIGIASGAKDKKDIEQVAIAWGRIAKRYPKVNFVIQGQQFPVIDDNVPEERIKRIPWMPLEQYPLGMMNIDIGCCPLDSNKFNICKTPIKAMEYAAADAAVVASRVLYPKLLTDGVDGLLADSANEWEQALSRLIEDYNFRRKITKALIHKIRREYSLEKNVWRWLDAWTDIVDNFRQSQRKHILIPDVRQVAEYGVRL